ncbi:hypothetical protein NDA03_25855 [Trichocoleus sp. Lan]|uniref:hypothetical protein n=1 Tax=Trichocoleus sp. Lan TaxID=2933927 RepID=UPI003299704D
MCNSQPPEEGLSRRPRYLDVLPPRLRQGYLDALRAMEAGDYSPGFTPEQQKQLDEYRAKFPKAKRKKRT